MIKEKCPDGVPYKRMGELGKFFGGLTGKSKEDFTDGNAKFISYTNVYLNPALQIDVTDRVKISDSEKQRTLQYGDIIFTGSSETPNECGISSVVTEKTDEKLYLNSFCFFFRFNDPSIMIPDFSKHLFRSNSLRYQISKTANGVIRFNVSKKLMEKVMIPIPPIEVQEEIVSILDCFAELERELEHKLEREYDLRKTQYTYYRDLLLTPQSIQTVKNKKIEEICTISRGRVISKDDIKEHAGQYPVYSSQTEEDGVLGYINTFDYEGEYVTWTTDGAKAGSVFHRLGKFSITNVCGLLQVKTTDVLPRYLFYALSVKAPQYVNKGMGNPKLMSNVMGRITIPVPPLEIQQQIVDVLDNFETICNDLSIGLPAEISSRKAQYEYYRDTLLKYAETGIYRTEQNRTEQNRTEQNRTEQTVRLD